MKFLIKNIQKEVGDIIIQKTLVFMKERVKMNTLMDYGLEVERI